IATPTQPEMAARAAAQPHGAAGPDRAGHTDCHAAEPLMRIRSFLVLVLAALPAACGRSPDEAMAQGAAPPPAAALAPLTGENTANQALELLAAELDAV